MGFHGFDKKFMCHLIPYIYTAIPGYFLDFAMKSKAVQYDELGLINSFA